MKYTTLLLSMYMKCARKMALLMISEISKYLQHYIIHATVHADKISDVKVTFYSNIKTLDAECSCC